MPSKNCWRQDAESVRTRLLTSEKLRRSRLRGQEGSPEGKTGFPFWVLSAPRQVRGYTRKAKRSLIRNQTATPYKNQPLNQNSKVTSATVTTITNRS